MNRNKLLHLISEEVKNVTASLNDFLHVLNEALKISDEVEEAVRLICNEEVSESFVKRENLPSSLKMKNFFLLTLSLRQKYCIKNLLKDGVTAHGH